MSDTEKEPVAVAVPEGHLDINSALKEVLKTSLIHHGLSRGLHEALKALDKREALLCVLSSKCDEPQYSKLIEALCKEHNIPLMKVEDKVQLGEWAGLCKIDKEGKAVKVVGCTCVVVRDYGKETPAHDFLHDHLKGK